LEVTWVRDGRSRNRLDDGRGHVADTKLLAPRWPELVLNLARTRLERGLQQPEHFTHPLWHHHHPSNSLDLLELPQGPALFTECLEWRLPLPLRSRSCGEPCPEEVALAAEAPQLDNRLPPGHPARRLYATLRDRAHADIATAE